MSAAKQLLLCRDSHCGIEIERIGVSRVASHIFPLTFVVDNMLEHIVFAIAFFYLFGPIFPQKSHPLWWKGFRVKMSEQGGAVIRREQ